MHERGCHLGPVGISLPAEQKVCSKQISFKLSCVVQKSYHTLTQCCCLLVQTYAALNPFFPVIPTRAQVQAFYDAVKVRQLKSNCISIWGMHHWMFDKPVSLQPYKLDKASVIQFINLAPTSLVELFLVSNLSLPQTNMTLLAPAGHTHVSHTAHTMLVVIIIISSILRTAGHQHRQICVDS